MGNAQNNPLVFFSDKHFDFSSLRGWQFSKGGKKTTPRKNRRQKKSILVEHVDKRRALIEKDLAVCGYWPGLSLNVSNVISSTFTARAYIIILDGLPKCSGKRKKFRAYKRATGVMENSIRLNKLI